MWLPLLTPGEVFGGCAILLIIMERKAFRNLSLLLESEHSPSRSASEPKNQKPGLGLSFLSFFFLSFLFNKLVFVPLWGTESTFSLLSFFSTDPYPRTRKIGLVFESYFRLEEDIFYPAETNRHPALIIYLLRGSLVYTSCVSSPRHLIISLVDEEG